MVIEEKVRQVIEEPLEFKGYDLVRIKMHEKTILSIDIDRLDGKAVTIDDCTEASRLISAILDVENFIAGHYNLEVSSPGESRPLSKIRDFERFCGQTAKIELLSAIDGKMKFIGEILGADKVSGDVKILVKEPETKEIVIPFSEIKKARVKRVF